MLEFVSRGSLEPNVERVVRLLRERRDAMLESFEAELPDGAAWSRPQGGYFTWVDLPPGTDAGAAARARRARGGHLRQGQRLLPERPGRSRLGPVRVQLRLSCRRPSGRRPAWRPSWRGVTRRRWRYSCESSIPQTSPITSSSRITQISRTVRGPEDEVDRDLLGVLDDERDRVADHEEEQPDLQVEAGLEARRAVLLAPRPAGSRHRWPAPGPPGSARSARRQVGNSRDGWGVLTGCDPTPRPPRARTRSPGAARAAAASAPRAAPCSA